jgi:uncharacterized protein (TIGR03032 family)
MSASKFPPESPQINPQTAIAQVLHLGQSGRLAEAIALCEAILDQAPQFAPAWHFLGLALLQSGQLQQALAPLQRAIALDPEAPEFQTHLGVVLCELGQFEAGIAAYRRSLELQPQAPDTLFNLGLALQKIQQLDAAIATYQQVIALNPGYATAYYQQGNCLQQQYRWEEAIACYHNALQVRPTYPEAQYNLGVALQAQGDRDAAQRCYEQALRERPGYPEALNALGALLQDRGQIRAALEHYTQVLQAQPNYLPALLNLAHGYQRLEEHSAAETAYRQVLALQPDHVKALDGLIGVLRKTAQWSELSALEMQLWQGVERRLQAGEEVELSPYATLFMPLTAVQQQAVAENHAQTLSRKLGDRPPLPRTDAPRSSERLRLGYVSGDFRHHAVAQLMLRLFELHDRQRVEVFAYSLGPDDDSSYRQKLMQDCDRFLDVRGQSPGAIAQQIATDQIDLLIDLAGYTDYACPEIFALRPAPLQINYLGYPGTLGSAAMDYIITDGVLTPPALASTLTEQCLYLPHSYQINNNQQSLPDPGRSRQSLRREYGLPETAFVYCCFNKIEKIEPSIFSTWMEILRRAPQSVLWLLASDAETEQRFWEYATSEGIAPERLIFAPRAAKAEHLTRHQAADLMLDTRYYNAHTTGSDALWAGVPLVTLLGETFAARVAASLLHAVGLPQLVTETLADYADLAVHLASHPAELAQLQAHLRGDRHRLPLFNTEQTVWHLEQLYFLAWERYLAQQPPAALSIGTDPAASLQATAISSPQIRVPQPAPAMRMTPPQSPTIAPESAVGEAIACQADEGFQDWLSRAGGSIVVTTYQAGKVLMVGWNGQQVTMLLRQFTKPMGMAIWGDRIALATQHEVVMFANAQPLARDYLERQPGRYDSLYLPRVAYYTGDLNIHDMSFGQGNLWMVNTRFSCLASLSAEYNFVPEWRPAFISDLAPEDRCHLNGLAMVGDRPKYVTALGESDEVGGWRPQKATGGIVIDVESNEVIQRGLSMPHSPQWYQGALWVLNSGTGELWKLDVERGDRTVICTLPGFGRGLCFVDHYALMGLCQIREQHIFGGLPVQERFDQLLCGVAIVDLRNGEQVGLLKFESGCRELYDVKFLPGKLRPTILNLEKQAVREAFSMPEVAYWLRPSNLIGD